MKNKVIQDELITEIRGLLLQKYPDYVFKEIFQDEDVNFPGAILIKIFFWDMENQRELWVCITVPHMGLELLTSYRFLIKISITRIDNELTKLKEEKS